MKRSRLSGFVVGKDKVRGQDTWKVRVKDTNFNLNGQKLKVASVWPGVTLAKGMDVQFEISEQHNAVNVAPRGVNTEGNPDMRKYIYGGLLGLVIVAMATISITQFFFKQQVEDLRIEWRVESTLEKLTGSSFYDLVPDSIVREMVQKGWTYPVDARELVYNHSVCKPILGKESIIEAEDRHSECWNTRYPVYGGAIEPRTYDYETAGEPDYWLSRSRIPVSAWNEWADTEYVVKNIARTHLANPENLWTFYQAKRDVFLAELNKLDGETQTVMREQIEFGLSALLRFNDPAVRTQWENTMAAETAWIAAYTEEYEQGLDDSHADEAWGQREAENKKLKEVIGFCELRISDDFSYTFCPGVYEVKYAGRRFDEGGQELVDTWIRMAEDILTQFNS